MFVKSTKQWNGLVGDVLYERADMIATSLTITPARSKVIGFSIPYLETGITIVVAVRNGVISPTAFLGMRSIYDLGSLTICLQVIRINPMFQIAQNLSM